MGPLPGVVKGLDWKLENLGYSLASAPNSRVTLWASLNNFLHFKALKLKIL
jgi:hypothetical protein